MLAVFHQRDGNPTEVVLFDGTTVLAYNIAWGYDLGDEYAHVTTNASPFIEGMPLDLFFTNEVARLVDPATQEVLFTQA